MNLPEKFLSRIEINEMGCWIWKAGKTSCGYGAFYENGKQIASHRYSYTKAKGGIPEKMDIDHLCRNRACCNPEHLEAVTRKANLERGLTLIAGNLLKTHCPRGHEYSKDNLIKSKKNRDCRICNLNRSKLMYVKKKMEDPNFTLNRNAKAREQYKLLKLKKGETI